VTPQRPKTRRAAPRPQAATARRSDGCHACTHRHRV
jgi:hypothetical protein